MSSAIAQFARNQSLNQFLILVSVQTRWHQTWQPYRDFQTVGCSVQSLYLAVVHLEIVPARKVCAVTGAMIF